MRIAIRRPGTAALGARFFSNQWGRKMAERKAARKWTNTAKTFIQNKPTKIYGKYRQFQNYSPFRFRRGFSKGSKGGLNYQEWTGMYDRFATPLDSALPFKSFTSPPPYIVNNVWRLGGMPVSPITFSVYLLTRGKYWKSPVRESRQIPTWAVLMRDPRVWGVSRDIFVYLERYLPEWPSSNKRTRTQSTPIELSSLHTRQCSEISNIIWRRLHIYIRPCRMIRDVSQKRPQRRY